MPVDSNIAQKVAPCIFNLTGHSEEQVVSEKDAFLTVCRAAFQCKDWPRLAQLMDENFELRRYDAIVHPSNSHTKLHRSLTAFFFLNSLIYKYQKVPLLRL